MPIKDDYKQDGNSRPFIFTIDGGRGDFVVASGTATCNKCGKLIPPAEMLCIPCFGQDHPPRKRAPKVRPDDDGLFSDQLAEMGTDGSGYE